MKSSSIVETWGTFPNERAEVFPCDDLTERPDGVLFRGVAVAAPSEVVFRWICQLRVAPYSYDWIDNLGRQSPRQLAPGLDKLEVEQRFMTIFRLVSFQDGRSITIESTTAAFGCVAVTYSVMPTSAHRCRLVAKVAFQTAGGLFGLMMRQLLPAGDLIMMRKQLLYVEGAVRARRRPAICLMSSNAVPTSGGRGHSAGTRTGTMATCRGAKETISLWGLYAPAVESP